MGYISFFKADSCGRAGVVTESLCAARADAARRRVGTEGVIPCHLLERGEAVFETVDGGACGDVDIQCLQLRCGPSYNIIILPAYMAELVRCQ